MNASPWGVARGGRHPQSSPGFPKPITSVRPHSIPLSNLADYADFNSSPDTEVTAA